MRISPKALIISITCWMVLPAQVLAQPTSFIHSGIAGCDFTTGAMSFQCIPSFIANAIRVVFGFTGGVFLIMLLFGAYQFAIGSISGGDTSAGKRTIRLAITVFLVSLLAFFIIDFFADAIAGNPVSAPTNPVPAP